MAKKKARTALSPSRRAAGLPVALKGRFSFHEDQEILRFLRKYPGLSAALNAFAPLAEETFPGYKDIALRVVSDPDGVEGDFLEALLRLEGVGSTQADFEHYRRVFDEKIFPRTTLHWGGAINARLNVGLTLC
jgi:hypothetical protein